MKEVQKVLDELEQVRPEQLTGEAKRLFEAIMKIADERDELLKERQADKEKIKELEAVNKRLRYTMNNAYLLDYIPRKQMEDKIEELENENKELKNKGTFIISDNKYEATDKEGFNDMINCRIREKIIIVLQELLKDGGE